MNKRLFVGHLNPMTEDITLRDFFSKFGEIADFIIMRNPHTKHSKCFGFITFENDGCLEQVLGSQPHYIDGSAVDVKKAVAKEDMPKKDYGSRGDTYTAGRLFIGRLNYDTNDTVLKAYFEKFGELSDCIVMRYPDTKRSKGFGFVTFTNAENMEECINSQPHNIDGKDVELSRATPKETEGSFGKHKHYDDDGLIHEPIDAEHKLLRKLFIGNLNYQITEEDIKDYFERYGTLEECQLMKFNDTGRSRGFAFITFEKAFMVDDCQRARPHEIGGKVLEVKRAAPKANSRDPEALANVKKLWVGGFDDNISDEDVMEYFSDFGNVIGVEQVKWHDTGKKRGFGFVKFDDHDPVDKIVLIGFHKLKGKTLEVKKGLSKQEMAALKEQQGKMQAGSWGSHHDSLNFNSSFSTGSGGSSFNNSGSFGNSFMNSNVMEMFMNSMSGSGGGGTGGGTSSFGRGGASSGASAGFGRGGSSGFIGSAGFGRGGGSGFGRGGSSGGYGSGAGGYGSGAGGYGSGAGGRGGDSVQDSVMEKMKNIYENMAAITSMTGVAPNLGFGGGPMRGGNYSGGARESSGPYARTAEPKKHYGW